MIRYTNTVVFLLMILIGYACAPGVRVVDTDAEGDFNLAAYQTYNFYDSVAGTGEVRASPQFLEEMNIIKYEIASHLERRGLRLSAEPELLVNIGAVVEEKVQTRQTDIREAPIYIGQRRYSWRSEEVPVSRYRKGTVSVHLVDRLENRLMWRGIAEGVIPENRERLRNNIENGVEELFKRVPFSQ